MATNLTRELYRIEAQGQPLTINSVVAAIILYRNETTLAVDEILDDAEFIFAYLMRKRAHKTTITILPSQQQIEAQIEGLGFKVENKGKKNSVAKLSPQLADPSTQLQLSYYAVNVSSTLFHEGFIAQFIKNRYEQASPEAP